LALSFAPSIATSIQLDRARPAAQPQHPGDRSARAVRLAKVGQHPEVRLVPAAR